MEGICDHVLYKRKIYFQWKINKWKNCCQIFDDTINIQDFVVYWRNLLLILVWFSSKHTLLIQKLSFRILSMELSKINYRLRGRTSNLLMGTYHRHWKQVRRMEGDTQKVEGRGIKMADFVLFGTGKEKALSLIQQQRRQFSFLCPWASRFSP